MTPTSAAASTRRRRGPPPWEDRSRVRSQLLVVRVNQQEHEGIKAAALMAGTTPSDLVRKATAEYIREMQAGQ